MIQRFLTGEEIKRQKWVFADLCHDLQGPAVPHADRLGGVGWDLTVLFGGPQQSRAKHSGQVMEGHLVDALFLCHPETEEERLKVTLIM